LLDISDDYHAPNQYIRIYGFKVISRGEIILPAFANARHNIICICRGARYQSDVSHMSLSLLPVTVANFCIRVLMSPKLITLPVCPLFPFSCFFTWQLPFFSVVNMSPWIAPHILWWWTFHTYIFYTPFIILKTRADTRWDACSRNNK
jgi:hypothetical protein